MGLYVSILKDYSQHIDEIGEEDDPILFNKMLINNKNIFNKYYKMIHIVALFSNIINYICQSKPLETYQYIIESIAMTCNNDLQRFIDMDLGIYWEFKKEFFENIMKTYLNAIFSF